MEQADPVKRYVSNRGIALQADIVDGIPVEMRTADVIYADPPWRAGYEEFALRAGSRVRVDYNQFLKNMRDEVLALDVPTILTAGRVMARVLMPDCEAKITLNGDECIACIWKMSPWDGVKDAEDVIRGLAESGFDRIGDFCCGYGRSGRIFSEHEKGYVMSDINPHCIGYIASQEWS